MEAMYNVRLISYMSAMNNFLVIALYIAASVNPMFSNLENVT